MSYEGMLSLISIRYLNEEKMRKGVLTTTGHRLPNVKTNPFSCYAIFHARQLDIDNDELTFVVFVLVFYVCQQRFVAVLKHQAGSTSLGTASVSLFSSGF